MSEIDELKERVLLLEQQMREFRRAAKGSQAVPGWKRKIGLFAGDEAFAEIVRLGARIRREELPAPSVPASPRATTSRQRRRTATTAKESR
jgi:hypothetical protein